jgi:hypothetical protein
VTPEEGKVAVRHGLNAKIFIDTSAAGTFAGGSVAAGTANLALITSKNTWAFDQSRAFVDVTAFLATSLSNVPGLPAASGDINGFLDFSDTLIKNVYGATTERAIMIFPDFNNEIGTIIYGKAFFSAKSGGSTTSADTLDLHFEAGPSGMSYN